MKRELDSTESGFSELETKTRFEKLRKDIKWLEENFPRGRDDDYANNLHRFSTRVDFFGFMAFCGDIPEEYLNPTKELMSRGDSIMKKYYAHIQAEATH